MKFKMPFRRNRRGKGTAAKLEQPRSAIAETVKATPRRPRAKKPQMPRTGLDRAFSGIAHERHSIRLRRRLKRGDLKVIGRIHRETMRKEI